ncbi:MAG: trimethylamine methyltransferase family protein, partial [Phycisphaerae bacterium]|nr:trimethylamine methyltransferase family protein [Phycisphaerae bacterium]
EIDQRIEPVWDVLRTMEITDKPIGGGEVFYAENIKHLVRLGEIYSGRPKDTRFVASCDFAVSPLRYGRRMLECMIEKSKWGVPHVPGSMTISGLSGPVTVAGTSALALAELIGGWVIYYLLDPELPVGGIVSTGSLDMRTTRASFGSPEAVLQDLTVVQAARRLYGIAVGAAHAYVDCKTPGIQAVFEKMLPLLAFPFEGGLTVAADGLLSAGQDYSPVQHLLSLDMRQAMDRFLGTFEVTEEALAVDLVDQIEVGSGETFLDKAHTLKHFKSQQWYPRWLDHRIWQGEPVERDAERKMLEQIDAYWKDAVARYEPPEIDGKRVEEARKVLTAAEEEMPRLAPKA